MKNVNVRIQLAVLCAFLCLCFTPWTLSWDTSPAVSDASELREQEIANTVDAFLKKVKESSSLTVRSSVIELSWSMNQYESYESLHTNHAMSPAELEKSRHEILKSLDRIKDAITEYSEENHDVADHSVLELRDKLLNIAQQQDVRNKLSEIASLNTTF